MADRRSRPYRWFALAARPYRFARLRKWIWGEEHSPTLASERLEALRRLAVEAWHKGYAVSLSALAAFRAVGFSTAQLELLLATISAGRTARVPGANP
ncbi:hypothetical protein ACFSUK_25365 [Sphingobium scionense]